MAQTTIITSLISGSFLDFWEGDCFLLAGTEDLNPGAEEGTGGGGGAGAGGAGGAAGVRAAVLSAVGVLAAVGCICASAIDAIIA